MKRLFLLISASLVFLFSANGQSSKQYRSYTTLSYWRLWDTSAANSTLFEKYQGKYFIEYLLDAIREGKLTAYKTGPVDYWEEFRIPIDFNEMFIELEGDNFSPQQITSFIIIEQRLYDDKGKLAKKKVVGICPVQQFYREEDTAKKHLLYRKIAWFYFPDLEKLPQLKPFVEFFNKTKYDNDFNFTQDILSVFYVYDWDNHPCRNARDVQDYLDYFKCLDSLGIPKQIVLYPSLNSKYNVLNVKEDLPKTEINSLPELDMNDISYSYEVVIEDTLNRVLFFPREDTTLGVMSFAAIWYNLILDGKITAYSLNKNDTLQTQTVKEILGYHIEEDGYMDENGNDFTFCRIIPVSLALIKKYIIEVAVKDGKEQIVSIIPVRTINDDWEFSDSQDEKLTFRIYWKDLAPYLTDKYVWRYSCSEKRTYFNYINQLNFKSNYTKF